MSYILDALKKSEQNRGNESIPNVQTIHSSSLNYHQDKPRVWPWIIIAVLIANIFTLIYFLKPETGNKNVISEPEIVHNPTIESNNSVIDTNKTLIQKPAVATPAISIIQEPEITAPAAEPKTLALKNTDVKIEPAATPRSKPVVKTVDIDELPAHIRQQIPDMTFSAHVYSSNPMQRSLVINNRFMEEGSAFSYDLTLIEITANGAIFNFQDYRFRTSVLSGWTTH